MIQGIRKSVQVGDKVLDVADTFRLYLCTRSAGAIAALPPNSQYLVSSVNFSVTRAGLEGQLLGVTLQHEKPELEQRKSEMLQKEEKLKLELATLEKNLLIQLAQSSGDILKNEALLSSLNETKASSL